MNAPLRIALAGSMRLPVERLERLLNFPHEFVTASAHTENVDAVIALKFGHAEAERFSTRLIHLPGAGADGIDFSALAPGCNVCNVFEHEGPIAEYVMLAILDHAVGYTAMTRAFSNERWSETYLGRRPHGEIAGTTLGLVGFGHIGKAVTERAKAFGMRVCAVTQSGRAPGADWVGNAAQLGEMLAMADFVVLACPLTAQTRGMLGAAQLAAMKPTAVLVNIARAEIIDEEALYLALESGRVAGATLDVWYAYPTPANAGARPSRFAFDLLPNVRCTPHSSAWTDQLFDRRFALVADNLARLRDGRPLRNVIYGPQRA